MSPVVVISPVLVSPRPAAADRVVGAAVRVVGGAEVAAGEGEQGGEQSDGSRHPSCSPLESACLGHTDQNGGTEGLLQQAFACTDLAVSYHYFEIDCNATSPTMHCNAIVL